MVKNAKSHQTEPGCQAYYFFVPRDGNEEFMYGIEMYPPSPGRALWRELACDGIGIDGSYDDQKAIKETHFNSEAFQTFAAYFPPPPSPY